jgi:adenylate kinase
MYTCVCGYQARGVNSHVYMCGYQARGVSSHGHTHIYMTTYSSALAQGTHKHIHDYSLLWLDTHTHIYTTTYYSGLIPTHILCVLVSS